MSDHPAAPVASPVTLEWIGPAGQDSPVFGVLEPGERYQCADGEFAAYLCRQHPTYWRLPQTPSRRAAVPAPTE